MDGRKWLARWGPSAAGVLAVGIAGWFVMPGVRENQRIKRLEPNTRRAYLAFLRLMSNRGIRIHTGQTKRSQKQQEKLVREGKSGTTRSWHLAGRAIDAYPYDPDTGKPDMKGRRVDLFRIMHDTASALGFKGLAFNPDGTKRYIKTRKGRVWDAGHIQFQGPHRTVAVAMQADARAIA